MAGERARQKAGEAEWTGAAPTNAQMVRVAELTGVQSKGHMEAEREATAQGQGERPKAPQRGEAEGARAQAWKRRVRGEGWRRRGHMEAEGWVPEEG